MFYTDRKYVPIFFATLHLSALAPLVLVASPWVVDPRKGRLRVKICASMGSSCDLRGIDKFVKAIKNEGENMVQYSQQVNCRK